MAQELIKSKRTGFADAVFMASILCCRFDDSNLRDSQGGVNGIFPPC